LSSLVFRRCVQEGSGLSRWLLALFVLIYLPGAALTQDPPAAEPSVPLPSVKESPYAQPPPPASNTPDYVVCPGDVLEIYVFEVPEISRSYRVSPDGFITLPLLPEPIAAAGLTPSQLSRVIAKRFRDAGLLANPQVTMSVKETRLHSVVIAGAVKSPQVYPVFGPTRLLPVLSQAGGLADDAGDIAVVNRGEIGMRLAGAGSAQAARGQEGSVSSSLSVDVRKLLETGDENLDLLLYPGDRVTVQRAGIVYVIGAVARPGGYPLKDVQEEMTVLKVLALAGDLTSSAQRNKVVILRRKEQAPTGREEIAVDLKRIIAGRAPDRMLYDNDILLVPENGRLKAMRQAIGTGIGMGTAITTGLIIYRR
jgi:polysaccharide biosynthesis/export protein